MSEYLTDGRRVLVCEDEPVLRELIRATLEPNGYQILEARTGEEALRLARASPPDLILMDITLPGANGLEILAELRRDPRLAETPVAVLSGRKQASDRDAAKGATAARFVAKPFTSRELVSVVEELLTPASFVRLEGEVEAAILVQERFPTDNAVVAAPHPELDTRVIESTGDDVVAPQAESVHSGPVDLTRSMMEATSDAIRVVDLHGRDLLINCAMERLCDELEIPNAPTVYEEAWLWADRTTDPARFRREFNAIQADSDRTAEYVWAHAESGRTFECRTAPVRDSRGRVVARTFASREVTRERLADAGRKEIVATAAHELRGPLTGILGLVEMLLEREPALPSARRYLAIIRDEIERFRALIDDLLDPERLEDNGLPIRPRPFELAELLDVCVQIFANHSANHVITLIRPGDQLDIIADRDRIAQVVTNLLANAVKYSPGGTEVKVVAEKRGTERVRVSIVDRGPGVSAADRERIFKKFVRGLKAGEQGTEGSGLGLALCREIVEAHDGEIGLETRDGAGSTFWFELPVARPTGSF
jgi:signal transduction histidine kinase/CheY-like chemotaxis protein